MSEVTRPIIATALVLCAVFVPTAFISGLTGQFYKQFAITIAISTVISAFNSLTLSPALVRVVAARSRCAEGLASRVAWIRSSAGFSARSTRSSPGPATNIPRGVGQVLAQERDRADSLCRTGCADGLEFQQSADRFRADAGQTISGRLRAIAGRLLRSTAPSRCHPQNVGDRPARHTGCARCAWHFPGLSISGFSVAPNAGIVFFGLKPFEERKAPDLSGPAIAGALNQQFAAIQDAFVLAVPPPPVMGLGTIGGFKLYVEDRARSRLRRALPKHAGVVRQGYQTPDLDGVFSTFTVNVPQLDADIDRVKAKPQGVPLQNLFETMQIYLGSLYVNDFNRFGRTYQVIAQADAQFRDRPEDITRLKTRNDKGQMVPLGTLGESDGNSRAGPRDALQRLSRGGNQRRPGARLQFRARPKRSMAKLASDNLPKGMAFEWTELTYQRILAGNTAIYVYPLCLLLVFLVLAAQYESFRLPLAIILIVPMCLLFAIAGVWLKGGDNNIFTQIGLIVLVGLACKNAILIVEFAKHKQDEGMSPVAGRIEACRLRLRPILMTSIAFIAGVFPLVIATRRRRRNAPGHGRRCVRRHDRRDAVRLVPDARCSM